MLLSDRKIIRYVKEQEMLSPFEDKLVNKIEDRKIISYGLSSFGYDCRLHASEFKVFSSDYKRNKKATLFPSIIDPMHFNPAFLEEVGLTTKQIVEDGLDLKYEDLAYELHYWKLPAKTYALALSYEYFCIPRNITAVAMAKSTYARCGIFVNVTPMEAEWSSQLVVEIYNAASLPVKIYPRQGFFQVQFHESDEDCLTSYADRGGKYQNQDKIVLAKV